MDSNVGADYFPRSLLQGSGSQVQHFKFICGQYKSHRPCAFLGLISFCRSRDGDYKISIEMDQTVQRHLGDAGIGGIYDQLVYL